MARLVDSPSTPAVPATTLSWTVTKDGASFVSTTADSFVFSPTGNGTYVVSVQATDSNGAKASRSVQVVVDATSYASTSAAFVGQDAATQGSWKGVYGSAGYTIATRSSTADASFPPYAAVTETGQSVVVWNGNTTDVRALQQSAPFATGRIASSWFGSQFTIDLNLVDGEAHKVSLYALDWDKNNRSERIDVIDANTGTLLDSQTISSFDNGVYLSWNVSGHVQFQVTSTGGSNAVVSGLFLESQSAPGAPPPIVDPPPSANSSFLGQDGQTQGSWEGVYGSGAYSVANSGAQNSANASISVSGLTSFTWAANTTDVRALQKAGAGATGRLASCWYGNQFTINVDLTDGATHQVSLYALDWDGSNRSERIDVIDANTGTLIDSQTISSFHDGVYLSWNVSGHVQFRVTKLSGTNAVVSGVFVESQSAPVDPPPTTNGAFLGQNDQTEGSWEGVYGSGAYSVANSGAQNSANASISVSGLTSFTWAANTTDVRALQQAGAGATGRIASCWYGNQLTINVDLTDGATHQVSLYALDWDGSNRSERIDVIDANTGTLIDSQTISSFHDGVYLSWNVSGHVQFRVTKLSGTNAVVSGVFVESQSAPVDPPPTTNGAFLGQNDQTEGSWEGVYGSGAYSVANSGAQNSANASISVSGLTSFTWAANTTDVRALQQAGASATGRIASCWYGNQLTINVDLTDGATHQVSLYALDWDGSNRSERIDVIDANTGTVIDSQTISSFHDGVYLSWNVSGHVQFRVTKLSGTNAVVSGVFVESQSAPVDPPPTTNGAFLGQDAQTQGNWEGVYGSEAYTVVYGGSQTSPNAAISVAGQQNRNWANWTTDVRALQNSTTPTAGRVAACWFGSQFTIDVDLTDGQTHKISLYALDWDGSNRSERIDVIDADTGTVLDSQSISSFHDGVYLSWNVSGHVQFRVTCTGGSNAVVSGVFIDGAATS